MESIAGHDARLELGSLFRASSITLAAPACAMVAATACSLLISMWGWHPLWPIEDVNVSEAAGLRDEGEVLRLVEGGLDTSLRQLVRPGIVSRKPAWLTPVETAIAANDPLILAELLAREAPLDAERWTYLRCIAEGGEVSALLDGKRPPGARQDCSGVLAPWPLDD